MRKILTILSTLMIVSMLLAACGQEETATAGPGTQVVPTDTAVVTEEPMVTEEPTLAETMQPAGTETPAAGIPVTGAENPYLLSNQLDYDIWNGSDEQIGEVEDMVIDLANSRVSFVDIETGGFLDIGDTESLVPWGALRLALHGDPDVLSADDNVFVLQVDQNQLEDSPDFDLANDLPAVGEPAVDWDADLNTYWNDAGVDVSAPVQEAATAQLQGVILATDLLDSDIAVDTNNDLTADDVDFVDDLAIDNVIVDIHSGQVKFVVLDGEFDDGERLMPVPLSHLQWNADEETFVLTTDQTTLEGAPFFENGVYPDTFENGWDTQYFDYWQ